MCSSLPSSHTITETSCLGFTEMQVLRQMVGSLIKEQSSSIEVRHRTLCPVIFVRWRSSKHSLITKSTCETELLAANDALEQAERMQVYNSQR